MNWKLFKKMGFYLIAAMLIVGCSEEDVNEPLENNSEKPGQVTDIIVENLAGKAKLSYTLPKDQDLLYIKADYVLENGREMNVKSSYYNSSMILEGFSGNSEVEISVTTVNRSEVESDPVRITVAPNLAPIYDVYESLEVSPAFGGIYVSADNPEREDIAILVMEQDEYGDWVTLGNSVYTSTNEVKSTLRGMDTINKKFAIAVRDRWLNYTDTLFAEIKPLFEEAIPKSGYRGVRLPNDAPFHPSTSLEGLWNGNIMDWPQIYLTEGTYTASNHILTFDMGVQAKLSRIVIWDYPEYFNGRSYYYLACMKRFRIYGSDVLETSGDLSKWTLLGEYEEVKPSGLPYGQQTNEDYQTANAGFSWDIPIEMPRVRYIRIENLENWAGGRQFAIGELQAYGNSQ
ncbi:MULTISPECIES: DUF4959 domain-containing protein [Leeuwenhoekiella]|uniref:F5/8 type C domain-containing protein n=1 Tax=Leeuwenhoekiella polynyae TaxID=1550906 RepID=A0A4Q0PD03_9FLAO|nr:DUF5000 domain-containing lipoprotein [Leeuwenhoekiella polynyae]RXG23909.1 putative protein DUF5126 [Leeuwenhoekiella polynyae]